MWKGTRWVQRPGCAYPSLRLALSPALGTQWVRRRQVQGSQARADTARRVNKAACPDSRPPGGPCGLPHAGGWTPPSAGVFKALLSPFLEPVWCLPHTLNWSFQRGGAAHHRACLCSAPSDVVLAPGLWVTPLPGAPWALAGTHCLPACGAAAFLITG